MPPFAGISWLPTMAPFSTTHLPPDLFLLARLCPVSAPIVQPASVLPSKIATAPSFSWANVADKNVASTARTANRRRFIVGSFLENKKFANGHLSCPGRRSVVNGPVGVPTFRPRVEHRIRVH